MIPESDEEKYERLTNLAMMFAKLDERSHQNQKQLDRIETMLTNHIDDEEKTFITWNSSLNTFKETVETKIHDSIDPIAHDLIRYKAIIAFLSSALAILIVVINVFKEQIIHWIGYH